MYFKIIEKSFLRKPNNLQWFTLFKKRELQSKLIGTQIIYQYGVVKLWNLKKQNCVNTFEMHGDKIWTMDLIERIEKIESSEES